jgi:hypothetical protein
LTQVKIPLGVTTIGWHAFESCSGLEQLEIPPSVTRIETGAFLGCSGLTRLHIPSSVMTLMDGAFCECNALRELQIPASISNLTGVDVFRGVKRVERLTLLGSTLSPGVVAILKGCLMQTAKVIGPALVGKEFGSFTISAT